MLISWGSSRYPAVRAITSARVVTFLPSMVTVPPSASNQTSHRKKEWFYRIRSARSRRDDFARGFSSIESRGITVFFLAVMIYADVQCAGPLAPSVTSFKLGQTSVFAARLQEWVFQRRRTICAGALGINLNAHMVSRAEARCAPWSATKHCPT